MKKKLLDFKSLLRIYKIQNNNKNNNNSSKIQNYNPNPSYFILEIVKN